MKQEVLIMTSKYEMQGIVVFYECYEAMAELTNEEKGEMFSAIMEYAQYGVIPQFGDRMLRSIWTFTRSKIDWVKDKYEETRERNRQYANTRWWKEYCKKNGIDPNDEDERKKWEETRGKSEALPEDADECQTMPDKDKNKEEKINKNISENRDREKAETEKQSDNVTVSVTPPVATPPEITPPTRAAEKRYDGMTFEEMRQMKIKKFEDYLRARGEL